ncbi:hypothetical protein Tco_1437452 [Tanacetum coccineum]
MIAAVRKIRDKHRFGNLRSLIEFGLKGVLIVGMKKCDDFWWIDPEISSPWAQDLLELSMMGWCQSLNKAEKVTVEKYGYVQKELTNDEVEFLKLFEEEIEVRLNYRDQMRRWEMYVNGRPLGPRRERPE